MLFWSLDRFSREGITKTIAYLQQLDAAGVKFKSLTEPFLDSDNELVAHILLGVLSYFAQLEASKISSRTKAGLERVRAQGKTLGRPDGFTLHGPILARMKAEGYSQGRMSRESGLAINTVKGYLKRLGFPFDLRISDEETVRAVDRLRCEVEREGQNKRRAVRTCPGGRHWLFEADRPEHDDEAADHAWQRPLFWTDVLNKV